MHYQSIPFSLPETVSKESRSLIDEDNSIQSKGDNPIFDGDLSVGTPRFFRLQREKEQLNKAQNEKSQKNNKKHEAVVSPVKSDSDISSETTGSWQIKTPVKREAGPDTRKSKSNGNSCVQSHSEYICYCLECFLIPWNLNTNK